MTFGRMGVYEENSAQQEKVLNIQLGLNITQSSEVGIDAVKVPMQSQLSRVSLKEQASKSKPQRASLKENASR